jgi:hypothetical protein
MRDLLYDVPTGDRLPWKRGTRLRRSAPETTLTIWACDTIRRIRIHPDFGPNVVRFSELVLLVPPE